MTMLLLLLLMMMMMIILSCLANLRLGPKCLMSLCRCRRSPVEWDRATSRAPGRKINGLSSLDSQEGTLCRTWRPALTFKGGVMFRFCGA